MQDFEKNSVQKVQAGWRLPRLISRIIPKYCHLQRVRIYSRLLKLLDNDDMQNYPDVNPVIEYPLYKRIQTAIITAAFVTNLVQLIWFICFNLTENRAFHTNYEIAAQIANAISAGLITAVLLFGLIKSIKDSFS